jgi:hypothetical protein
VYEPENVEKVVEKLAAAGDRLAVSAAADH